MECLQSMGYSLFKHETILHMEWVNLTQSTLKRKHGVILHKPVFSHLLGSDLMWGKKAENIIDSMGNLDMLPCLWGLGSELFLISHVWRACYQVGDILWEGCGALWRNVGHQKQHWMFYPRFLWCSSHLLLVWHDRNFSPHSNSRMECTLTGCLLSHGQLKSLNDGAPNK